MIQKGQNIQLPESTGPSCNYKIIGRGVAAPPVVMPLLRVTCLLIYFSLIELKKTHQEV